MSKPGISAPLARLTIELSFILSALVVYVLSWGRIGIQLPLATFALTGTLLLLSRLAKRPLYRRTVIFLGLAGVISLLSSFRLDNAVTAINLWSVLFLTAFAGLNQVMPGKLWLKEYFWRSWTLPFKGAAYFGSILVASKLSLNRHLSRSQQSVLRGVLWSLPILVVFGLLFASADAVFKDLFSGLADLNAIWRTIFSPKIILTFLFTIALSGMLYYVLQGEDKASERSKPKRSYPTEVTIMLGLVNILFFMFVIIQAVYLFGGHDVVLGSDLTYAEYGRKGFFELVWVAVGVFSLGFVLKSWDLLKAHKLNTVLLYVLIGQVGIILVSALKRLSLYEQAYGYSELRLYAHLFVPFIAGAFVLLVMAVKNKWFDTALLYRMVLLAMGYVLLINVINVPAMIARQNIAHPPQNGQIDYGYIMTLSADALPEQVRVLRSQQSTERGQYYTDLICYSTARASLSNNRHWSEFNFAESRARELYSQVSCNQYRL